MLRLIEFESLSKYIYHPAKHFKDKNKLISEKYFESSNEPLKEENIPPSKIETPVKSPVEGFREDRVEPQKVIDKTKRNRSRCSNCKDLLTNIKNPNCLRFYIILVLVLVVIGVILVAIIIPVELNSKSNVSGVPIPTTKVPVTTPSVAPSTSVTLFDVLEIKSTGKSRRIDKQSVDPNKEFTNVTRVVSIFFICFF